MDKSFKCVFVLLFACLVRPFCCSTLEDVESIPASMHTPGSELLGKKLSLDIGNTARLRRNHEHYAPVQRYQHDPPRRVYSDRLADMTAAGSQVQDFGYRGVNGHSYGDERKESDSFEKENSGASRGEIGFYGRAGKHGSTEHVANDGYQKKERGSHDDASNAGFYDNASGVKKVHDVAKAYQGAENFGRKGEGVEKYGTKGGHRKGHHKSGFTNSYHKDESGNKSNFFDDANDEGGHFISNIQDGYFNDHAGNKQHGNFQDAAFKNNAQGKKGQFNEGQTFNGEDGRKGNYARDRYNDEKLDYGERRAGESYDQRLHGAQQHNDVNHYDKNGQGYAQRQGYTAYQPTVVPRQRNYYPVHERVGSEEQYYPVSQPAYSPTPVYAPSLPHQDETPEYYPPPPQATYYPVKPDTYNAPLTYTGIPTTGRGYATYSNPKSAAPPQQYYLTRGEVYYPPSATY